MLVLNDKLFVYSIQEIYWKDIKYTFVTHFFFERTKHSYHKDVIDAGEAGPLLQDVKFAVCGHLIQLRIVIDRLKYFT